MHIYVLKQAYMYWKWLHLVYSMHVWDVVDNLCTVAKVDNLCTVAKEINARI